MNSSQINGAVSESIVETELHRMGYPVSIPRSEQPYDMIVEVDGDLIKVQVKTVFKRDDGASTQYRVELRPQSGGSRSTYDSKDVDAFAFYNKYVEEIYWLWFDEAPATEASRKRSSWNDHVMWSKLSDYDS